MERYLPPDHQLWQCNVFFSTKTHGNFFQAGTKLRFSLLSLGLFASTSLLPAFGQAAILTHTYMYVTCRHKAEISHAQNAKNVNRQMASAIITKSKL